MTVDDIITKIRYRLADYTDESYDDDTLLTYINDGAVDFAMTGAFQTYHDFTTAGSNAYEDLSAMTYAWLNVFGVQYNGGKIDHAPPQEMMDWNAAAGTPKGWAVWGDLVYMDAIPTASNTVKVWYVFIPDAVTSVANTSPVDDKWAPALVAYAVGRCLDQNREETSKPTQEYVMLKATAQKLYEGQMMSGGFA